MVSVKVENEAKEYYVIKDNFYKHPSDGAAVAAVHVS